MGHGNRYIVVNLTWNGNLRITAFDVIKRHVENLRGNMEGLGLGDKVKVVRVRFKGVKLGYMVYTSEALLYTTDIKGVLYQFLRVLEPGEHLVLYK